MSPPLGAHDTFTKRSFESVIVGYILSQESYVTAPCGRLLEKQKLKNSPEYKKRRADRDAR